MKTKLLNLALLSAALLAVQGCIAFPPLVQVEKKDSSPSPPPPNPELMRRLDSIDQRLNQLEQRGGPRPEHQPQ